MVDKVSFIKEQLGELIFTNWELSFIKPAKTSRNTLLNHKVCFVLAYNDSGEIIAKGEIAPIIGLSEESWADINLAIAEWMVGNFADSCNWPSSIHAAIDMLFQDIQSKPIPKEIPINGLVWMNQIPEMREEAMSKREQGFDCIKFKVGALNFDDECALIHSLRNKWGSEVEIRLDANGAWSKEEAQRKIETLSQWNIHSIEQPITSGQWKEMRELCNSSPIPIALDEELIGNSNSKLELINEILPKYIVLKPSLHGGFDSCDEWIKIANSLDIKWWATSALESNVGLSHIYRWLGNYEINMPQGLGTGHLYTNNWQSPLTLNQSTMYWDKNKMWIAPWS